MPRKMTVSSNELKTVHNVPRNSIHNHRNSLSYSSDCSSTHDSLEQDSLVDQLYDRQPSKWEEILASIIPSRSHSSQQSTMNNSSSISCWKVAMPTKGRRWRSWMILAFKATLVFALASLLSILAVSFYSDDIHRILNVWGKPGHVGYGLANWPTDFSRGILPIPCHSHNDYWRRVPVYSAISVGCISVEADIWLFDEELYVGHSISSLTPNRTLNSLYINPILDILSKQNPTTDFHDGKNGLDGVFDTTPSQSLILLIDFKTTGSELWPYVLSALQPFRERGYLTHVNGTQIIQRPITVVGTGNTPFNLVASETMNPHLDIFFDAPLDEIYDHRGDEVVRSPKSTKSLHSEERKINSAQSKRENNEYTVSNSFYASVAFGKVFGHLKQGRFSDKQLEILRGQVRAAHDRGLKARYWDLPFWPISLRNHVWDILVKEGVDLLNVDDLKGATQIDWTQPQRGLWWW